MTDKPDHVDFPPRIKGEDNQSRSDDKRDLKSLLKERQNGILTTADREFLLGLRDYKYQQTTSNRKQNIRERIIASFQDFAILVSFISDEEINKIFNQEVYDEDLQRTLALIVAFIYRGLNHDKDRFEQIIETGIYFGANYQMGERWSGEVTDVNASIDIDYNPDVEKLYQRFKQGGGKELTPAQIGVLVRSGKLEPDDLEELEDTDSPAYFTSSR